MLLILVTLVAATNADKLRAGQQPPPGAAEAGGGGLLGAPVQASNPHGYGGKSGSVAGPAAPVITILSYSNQPNHGDGSYSYRFEADNGIQVEEAGSAIGPEKGISVQGSYSYISPDGQTIAVSYTAGEGGFVPQGDHIPTSPPIPEEIQKALAQNAADEAAGIFDDGSYFPSPGRPGLACGGALCGAG